MSAATGERKGPRERAVVAALVALVLVHAWGVVRDFSGPLVAAGDANYFEYLGHYLHDHLRWGPPLSIDFATDEVAYPLGTNIVYLSWCAERDLLHALALSAFGPGPFIQLYVAASDLLTALGVYVLLRREVGPPRAALVAVAASVMGFYAAFKFPYHLNLCALHWASMSIVLDWLVARRVLRGERLDALTVLVRIALLGLTVGLDIAYVAGFALVSFTVTTIFLLAWLARSRRRGGPGLADVWPRGLREQVRARPAAFAAWAVLLAVALVVYVPFDFAVVKGSRVYDFRGPGGNFWANQLRVFFPYLPFVHPGSELVHRIFGDADGVGELSTGWALLVAAAWGVRDAWRGKRLQPFVPLLVTFALSFAFHPTRFRTLHLFPWFMFNRVAGRCTIFLPLFFALAALGLDEGGARARRWLRVVVPVAALEILVAYGAVHTYRPFRPTEGFFAHMRAIEQAPGRALLEWPFCIAGANGVGTSALCPYYKRQSTSYAYRRFHGKSVVGFYLSRTHPVQIEPWLAAGWPEMFSPDVPDPHRATRQTRCFDARRWDLFTDFYLAGDFAGIQLYADLEAPECLDELYRRFGRPAHETVLPGIGRAQFLPRDPATRGAIDPARARAVRLAPPK